MAANGSKGAKSPMVIGIIEEAHDDHILVVTRDKFERKLTFKDDSKIVYVGYDDAEKKIQAKCAFRAQVKDEVIGTIYVTPDIGTDDTTEPTPEMLKMTPAEIFEVADRNKNGRVCYVEVSKTIKYSLKHGPISFGKCDKDKSGALSPSEFSSLLEKTEWWRMSRKTDEEWFKGSDLDKNGVLSKKELAHLLGKEAHLDTFFKQADKNASGDLDLPETSAFIQSKIFPSLKAKNQKKK
jgi:Ca2+-binding EF-hand superfamily protein